MPRGPDPRRTIMSGARAIERMDLPRVAQIGYGGGARAARSRGRPADGRLELAFGWSGDVEIELIQWVSGDCPHREFIEKGREGMHHLHFRVEDCDGWVEKLRPLG